jgi:hypothetical protein
MNILFLDQNKWIDIARVDNGTSRLSEDKKLFRLLVDAIETGQVITPLTETLIIETSKKNDLTQRRNLARTQSRLSKGLEPISKLRTYASR